MPESRFVFIELVHRSLTCFARDLKQSALMYTVPRLGCESDRNGTSGGVARGRVRS
jgi:hypothetical protein